MKGLNRKCYTTTFQSHGNIKPLFHKVRLTNTNNILCECDNIRIVDMTHWCFGCAYNRLASDYILAETAKYKLITHQFWKSHMHD